MDNLFKAIQSGLRVSFRPSRDRTEVMITVKKKDVVSFIEANEYAATDSHSAIVDAFNRCYEIVTNASSSQAD